MEIIGINQKLPRAKLTKRDRQEARRGRALELRKLPYSQYLKTKEWQQTRHAAMIRAGFRCQICNTDREALNVHHRTYERVGEEANADLIVLCASCHDLFHENGKLKR